jgi:hypothetical protein
MRDIDTNIIEIAFRCNLSFVHDLPLALACPDVLSLVGKLFRKRVLFIEPHIVVVLFFITFLFID